LLIPSSGYTDLYIPPFPVSITGPDQPRAAGESSRASRHAPAPRPRAPGCCGT